MTLNTFKCNYLTPLHFKGLRHTQQLLEILVAVVLCNMKGGAVGAVQQRQISSVIALVR